MNNWHFAGILLFFGMLSMMIVLMINEEAIASDSGIPACIKKTIENKADQEVRIHLKEQLFAFYRKGELVFWGKICSGKKGMETPKGRFKVLGKNKDYVSKKYKSKMPHAVRFTNDGHFLHQGTIKEVPASHGCVRLSSENAKRIFALVRPNDPIVVE